MNVPDALTEFKKIVELYPYENDLSKAAEDLEIVDRLYQLNIFISKKTFNFNHITKDTVECIVGKITFKYMSYALFFEKSDYSELIYKIYLKINTIVSGYTMTFRTEQHFKSIESVIKNICSYYQKNLNNFIQDNTDNDSFIKDYEKCWKIHQVFVRWISIVFINIDISVSSTNMSYCRNIANWQYNDMESEHLANDRKVTYKSIVSTTTAAHRQYYVTFFNSSNIESVNMSIFKCIFNIINNDRIDIPIDISIIRNLLNLILIMSGCNLTQYNKLSYDTDVRKLFQDNSQVAFETNIFYLENFNNPFIKSSREYYESIKYRIITSTTSYEYCRTFNKLLEKETTKIKEYIPMLTVKNNISNLRALFIDSNVEHIVTNPESGIYYLLEKQDTCLKEIFATCAALELSEYPTISGFYSQDVNLYKSNPIISEICKIITKYVFDEGKKIEDKYFKDVPEKDVKTREYMVELIKFMETCNQMSISYFNNYPKVCIAIKYGLTNIFDKQAKEQIPQFISELYNEILCGKLCGENITDDRVFSYYINKLGNDIIPLITNKDIMIQFYNSYLVKRLLKNNCQIDKERECLSIIQGREGINLVAKSISIINDYETSLIQKNEYTRFLKDKGSAADSIDFTMLVLSQGAWKLQHSVTNLATPAYLQDSINTFSKYYTNLNPAKKYNVAWGYGSAEIAVTFDIGVRTLTMSPLQAIILMAFNDKESYTISELSTLTGISNDYIKPVIGSLCFGGDKVHVLKKKPVPDVKPNALNNDSEIFFNKSLNCPKMKSNKITLSNVVLGSSKESNTRIIDEIENERKYRLEAIIVRIMKTRKTLKHAELFESARDQCRSIANFILELKVFKIVVGTLVERNYLNRDEEDTALFHYNPGD